MIRLSNYSTKRATTRRVVGSLEVRTRDGWSGIPAVRDDHLCEIKSCDILRPGPAALTDHLRRLHEIAER